MINQDVLARSTDLQKSFRQAEPFPHVVIEEFFTDELMVELYSQFPSFEARNAMNEFGQVGGKAVVTELDALGPAYRRIYAYLNSQPFLDAMSALTGIPDLLPDPALYGGGTHENIEGQELDVHVDYNYSQDGTLHRRLNLLVYFSKEWVEDWGGCIELHSNPRSPAENKVSSFAPLYNRALIFETSERSWHGFKKIQLPAERKGLTRRSLAIYLYTRTRPPEEIAPPHSTFYVQRPLPEWFRPGHLVTEESAREIQILMTRRDHWIEFYQKKELRDSAEMQNLHAAIASLQERPAWLPPAVPASQVLESEQGQRSGPTRLSIWLVALKHPPYFARLLYYSLPLSVEGRRKLKDFVFSWFGFLFRQRQSYRNWQELRQKEMAGRETPVEGKGDSR
jgi:Rps23 Pro-64 3,4-dihydroxylase Tpa1-like proline 4-hydroxylase